MIFDFLFKKTDVVIQKTGRDYAVEMHGAIRHLTQHEKESAVYHLLRLVTPGTHIHKNPVAKKKRITT